MSSASAASDATPASYRRAVLFRPRRARKRSSRTFGTGLRLEPERRVFAVAELRVPQLVAMAVRQERARYAEALLSGLREREDWPVLRETLVAWAECGFQLVGTARRLAVHRNTLLYRLAKIEELSTRDVRDPRTAMALYLACLADAL
ncbi:PucR family transcriptional regulator [Streptomyces mirabilis]|uniref:PucR family transcriptional regulator n=2 Tax=Streptomyces mirabilis TaxID=68239 RepID=UPI0034214DB0